MTTTPVTETQKKRLIKPSRGQARFAFTILLIINILNYADRYVLSAVLPQIKHEFNMTDFQGGLLISSFLIVYAVTTLPIGIWADRGIRKNIVAICVGVWSVATTFAGFTRNLFQLFSMRSILGIGEAGYAPASLSLLGDFFSKTHRGRILSFWSIGTLIGAAIGVSVGGRIADTLGWRWAFYIVGIPGLIAAFLAWRIKEPKRGVFDTEEGESGENAADTSTAHGKIDQNFWGTARALLRIPTYWVLLGALTFSFFTIGGTSFWLTTYLTGTIIGGWLADFLQSRRPQGRMITSVLGFLLGAPLVLVALSIHIFPVFIGVFVVAAISLNFCTGPLNAVIQDVIAPDMRATAVGLALLLAHLLGDAAAPTVIGFISDISSLGTALLVTAPLFLFLAGLVSLIGVKTVASDMRRMQEQLRAR